MKILITGGTGFIGSMLALRLLKDGKQVVIIGQVNNEAELANRTELEEHGAQVLLFSVLDREKVLQNMGDVDVVYHLAAAQHEANVPDQVFWDVNVTGTQHVLEAAEANGVKRFVHGSTIGVYGSALSGCLDEKSPLKPDNIYGVTKLEGEKLVASFRESLPVVITRISETYGPGDRRLLKLFRAIKKNVFFMIGNGKNLHHLIYIDDLINGLIKAAEAKMAVGETVVLAGTESLTTNEMVNVIADQVNGKVRFRLPLFPFLWLATIMEFTLRPLGIQPPLHHRRVDFFVKGFEFNTATTSEKLGFKPQYTFRQGAAETVRWYTERGYL
jgi:dihydroflavonol-4-reductase